jgi:Arc/MetJ-type ribon-helix-helix transcriptional regulator
MKERVCLTVDKELVRWIDKRVKDKIFANRSHAVEYLIKRKIDSERV